MVRKGGVGSGGLITSSFNRERKRFSPKHPVHPVEPRVNMHEKVKCPGCNETISTAWTVCPYCGHGHDRREKKKRVKNHPGRPRLRG
jgi:hypothetical protein